MSEWQSVGTDCERAEGAFRNSRLRNWSARCPGVVSRCSSKSILSHRGSESLLVARGDLVVLLRVVGRFVVRMRRPLHTSLRESRSESLPAPARGGTLSRFCDHLASGGPFSSA